MIVKNKLIKIFLIRFWLIQLNVPVPTRRTKTPETPPHSTTSLSCPGSWKPASAQYHSLPNHQHPYTVGPCNPVKKYLLHIINGKKSSKTFQPLKIVCRVLSWICYPCYFTVSLLIITHRKTNEKPNTNLTRAVLSTQLSTSVRIILLIFLASTGAKSEMQKIVFL